MSAIATYRLPVAGRVPVQIQDLSTSFWWTYGVIGFCLIHIPLGLLINRFTALSTVHAVVVFGVGIWLAVTSPRRPVRVAYVAAYIVGGEVLWRMTHSQVFWEFGKYSISALLLVAILRRGRLQPQPIMFTFFALLMPSVVLVITRLGFAAQAPLSFFMAGPFEMTIVAWFCWRLKLTIEEVRRLFLVAIAPIVGIATVAVFGIYTAKELTFGKSSNFLSSGGFGPNQVSATLGLGVLFGLMFIVLGQSRLVLKLFVLGLTLLFAAQSVLTFSRGGIYNVIGAAAAASIYLIRDSRTRQRFALMLVIVFVVGSYFIFPQLESFTSGKLTARFTNTDTSNRAQIAFDELRVFREYPILGVGPGGSDFVGVSTAHTEFTRLPAEHGVFGAIAVLLLLAAAVINLRKTKTMKGKAIVIALIGWGFMNMLNSAMRLAAPGFVIGLTFATIVPDINTAALTARRVRRSLRGRVRLRHLRRNSVSGKIL